MQRFRDDLWQHLAPSYAAIEQHPFLAGLLDGSLPHEVFVHYVLQDAHYLRDYARALAITGAKSTDDDSIIQFCTDAAGAITVERSLHDGFVQELNLGSAAEVVVQPTTLAYTSYLIRTAYQGSFAEAVAVVLPCYWIYARVGQELLARTEQQRSPNPLYQRWIDTYGGEEFQDTVEKVLATVDRLGPQLSPEERGRFIEHVVITAKYEWLFWDAAWRLESWPQVLQG